MSQRKFFHLKAFTAAFVFGFAATQVYLSFRPITVDAVPSTIEHVSTPIESELGGFVPVSATKTGDKKRLKSKRAAAVVFLKLALKA